MVNLKQSFFQHYNKVGEEKFVDFLIDYANDRIKNNELKKPTPEIEMMVYYEKFLQFYRAENNEIYLSIAKVFRKVGHIIYRSMLKKGIAERSKKFLNEIEQ